MAGWPLSSSSHNTGFSAAVRTGEGEVGRVFTMGIASSVMGLRGWGKEVGGSGSTLEGAVEGLTEALGERGGGGGGPLGNICPEGLLSSSSSW